VCYFLDIVVCSDVGECPAKVFLAFDDAVDVGVVEFFG
jgi:hypothetical protein